MRGEGGRVCLRGFKLTFAHSLEVDVRPFLLQHYPLFTIFYYCIALSFLLICSCNVLYDPPHSVPSAMLGPALQQ